MFNYLYSHIILIFFTFVDCSSKGRGGIGRIVRGGREGNGMEWREYFNHFISFPLNNCKMQKIKGSFPINPLE